MKNLKYKHIVFLLCLIGIIISPWTLFISPISINTFWGFYSFSCIGGGIIGLTIFVIQNWDDDIIK